jgi:hypothetical protein
MSSAEAIDLAVKMADYEAGSFLASRRRNETAPAGPAFPPLVR